jgi:osmotically inducible protein OsmC
MFRKATAQWNGDLKSGKGTFSVDSGAFKDLPYSWTQRFENTPGTNPEELIAAAHASCYSMAFSGELGKANLKPDWIKTTCTLTFEKTDKGFAVTESHLTSTARVPRADKAAVEKAAADAKAGCPISRLLNTKITLELKVET